MADNKRQLKIPRSILADAFNGNPQAIKAMEGLQQDVFERSPTEIKLIIESINETMAVAIQAAIAANQPRDQHYPQLNAVSVPMQDNATLGAVNVPVDNSINLNPVNTPCGDQFNYLVSV